MRIALRQFIFVYLACISMAGGSLSAWGSNGQKHDPASNGTVGEESQPMVTDVELMEKYGANLKAAIPSLIEGLKNKDASIRRNAAFALGELGSDAEPALNELSFVLQNDSDLEVRRNAAFALGEIGVPAIHVLLSMLNDKDPRVRRNVTSALVRIGQPAIPSLVKLLKDGDPIMRRNSAVILGNIGPKAGDAIPALEKALQDPDKGFCWTVKQALRKIKQTSSEDMVEGLNDKDTQVRINTMKELGEMSEKAEGAIPSLITHLNDDKAAIRKQAAFALAKIGPPAVPALREALKSKDVNTRKNAVFCLGEMGKAAESALSEISELKNDQDSNVRYCADIAIKKIQGK